MFNMFKLDNQKKKFVIVKSIIFLLFLLIFMLYGVQAGFAQSLTGTVTDSATEQGIGGVIVTINDESDTTTYTNCKRFDFKLKEITYDTEEYSEDYNIMLYSVWCDSHIGIVKEKMVLIKPNGDFDYFWERELIGHSFEGTTPHEYMPLEEGATWDYKVTYGEPGYIDTYYTQDICLGSETPNGETYWGIYREGSWVDVYRFDGDDIYEVWDDALLPPPPKSVAHSVPRAGKISAAHRILATQNESENGDVKEYLFLRFGLNIGDTYTTKNEITAEEDVYVYEDFEFGKYMGEETFHVGDYVGITDSGGNYQIYDAPDGTEYILNASKYGYDTFTQSDVTAGVCAMFDFELDIQTLIAGNVFEFDNGSSIYDATVTVKDGAARFENCERFDFTYEETTDYGDKYLGIFSIWLAPDVGIVKQTYYYYDYYYEEDYEYYESDEFNLIDYGLSGSGAHEYLPLQEDATWNYIEKYRYIDGGYDSDYEYYIDNVTCSQSEVVGYWELNDVGEFSVDGDYVYIYSLESLMDFLFGYWTYPFGKPAPRALAKVGKTAAVQHTQRTHNEVSDLQVFRFNRTPGHEWNIYNEDDMAGNMLNITGKYVGTEQINIADSRITTDESGNYSFLGIPSGSDYTVTASMIGYLPSTKSGVTLAEGEMKTVDFSLIPMELYHTVVSVAEAASMGIMNQYCYIWDAETGEYIPISATEDTPIPPWTGFWVAAYQNAALYFPGNLNEPYSVTQGDIPEQELEVQPNKWYLISPPLFPWNDGFIGINDAIGDELGPNQYEKTWRIAKWWYDRDYSSFRYYYYDGQDPDPYGDFYSEDEPFWFVPGKGFWLYHMNDEPITIIIEQGDNYNPQEVTYFEEFGSYWLPPGEYYEFYDYYENGSDDYEEWWWYGEHAEYLGAYMTGNPYWFDIKWKDCQVVVDSDFLYFNVYDGNYVIPKTAVFSPDTIEKWHIRLKLESLDGSAVDTYNRAGVVMTEGADCKYFWAFDMEPMGSYVRLMLKDPSEPNRIGLAYDYRAPGLDEYTWEVDLTTTYSKIDARLSFADFNLVSDDFLFTLLDTDTGKTYTINASDSFEVSLSSGNQKKFLLTATRVKDNPSDSGEKQQPVSFGILNVYPNPFNPSTTIIFGLENKGNVRVRIYNIGGQLVDTIVNTHMEAGTHKVVWNAGGNSSGVYLVMVESNGRKDTREVTFIK